MRHKIIFQAKGKPRKHKVIMKLIEVIEAASDSYKMHYELRDRKYGATITKYIFEFEFSDDNHDLGDKYSRLPAITRCEDCLEEWYGCLIVDADLLADD